MLEWTRQGVSGDEGGIVILDQTVWWVRKFLKLPRKQTKKYNKPNHLASKHAIYKGDENKLIFSGFRDICDIHIIYFGYLM
jgi:hypothetical protein